MQPISTGPKGSIRQRDVVIVVRKYQDLCLSGEFLQCAKSRSSAFVVEGHQHVIQNDRADRRVLAVVFDVRKA